MVEAETRSILTWITKCYHIDWPLISKKCVVTLSFCSKVPLQSWGNYIYPKKVTSTSHRHLSRKVCLGSVRKPCLLTTSRRNIYFWLDGLWGQLIKLIQVVSTSKFHEYWWNDLDLIFLVPAGFCRASEASKIDYFKN